MGCGKLFVMNGKDFLETARLAAREAGALLRAEFGGDLKVNSAEQYDIKLELDVRTQELITRILLERHPDHAVYGEEGVAGNIGSDHEWVVDPIDGTVNFFHGIPHFCVSIAIRRGEDILAGVIYDPMVDEIWEVAEGVAATRNGESIAVSPRTKLSEAVLTVGFSKSESTIHAGLPLLEKMVYKARKCRMLGSAALGLAYVASGRLDAFIETGLSLWDVAAGIPLIESAGGRTILKPSPTMKDKFAMVAWNGRMDLELGEDFNA